MSVRIKEWVVGFLVDPETDSVLLIRKKRPAWMAGLLNGIGGKVEEGETPEEAMRREFFEEAGAIVSDWRHLVSMSAVTVEDRSGGITDNAGWIHFYAASWPLEVLTSCVAQTDETLEVYDVGDLISVQHPLRETWWLRSRAMVPNLRWLLPLAVHVADAYEPFVIRETSTTLRTPTAPTGAT